MNRKERFSKRFSFDQIDQAEVTVRQDAPRKLRAIIPIISKEVGLTPKPLRELVCQVLREVPDPNNWSEYPNIQMEVNQLLENCRWYKVYDIIEEIHLELRRRGNFQYAQQFEEEINRFFAEDGIGWKLEKGD